MANEIIGRPDVVIPDEYINEIIQLGQKASAVMSLARKVPMATGSATMPVLSLLPVAGFVNPRDTGSKALTYAKWEGIHLVAEDIACIVPIPEAILDDTEFDLAGELQPAFATAIARAIDFAALWGTGAPATWPTGGVYQHAVDAGNTYTRGSIAGEDLAEDLNNTLGLVEDDGYDADGWVMRKGVRRTLRGLRDNVNRPIFNPANPFEGVPAQLYDVDLQFTQFAWDATKADAIVGDWSNAVIGQRRDLTFKLLTEATLTNPDGSVAFNLAQQNMVGIRVYMRLGFAIARPVAADSLAVDEAHRSPFAVLAPAA